MKVHVLTETNTGTVLGVFTRERPALALQEDLARDGVHATLTSNVEINEEHHGQEDG